ncbi:MAG: TlpA disulfide reductase family protein [Actinomycetota bacterium]|nr:TlpA disulfide reductase family protein [Actinomycetota bacterium]
MTAKSKKQNPTKGSKNAAAAPKRKFPVVGVVFSGVALLLIAAIVLSPDETIGGGGEYGEPNVTGEAVPLQASSGASVADDPAFGVLAPEMSGVDFDDSAVSIAHDGTPKAIVFLAHWCPHCQAEVPRVQAWLDATGGVEGVEVMAVSTSASSGQNNWPPSDWLDRENWSVPTIRDNAESDALQAFGGSAFPYWIFLNGDGTVAFRQSGQTEIATLQSIMETLAATQP